MAIIREYTAQMADNGLMYLAENGMFRAENRRVRTCYEAARVFIDAFQIDKKADENMICIVMNSSGYIIGAFRMTSGSINGIHFDVGGIARKALLLNGVSVIMAHNHPGGVAEPSEEDIYATQKVQQGLALIGITLLDHIVITSDGNYVSMKEDGYI